MRASFLTHKSQRYAAGIDPRVKLGLCVAGSLASIVIKSPLTPCFLLITNTSLALPATRSTPIRTVCLGLPMMLASTLRFSLLLSLAVLRLVR